ncbi:hypothetical protein JCM8202v2_005827 [Rhodotorula sphaerocarpa]
MSDASLSSREPLLSQLATSDDALRRSHNARPGSPRTEKDDQGPYSGNTSPTYTGSAPWTPVEARNSSLAASRRSSWWPSSARAAGYARPGSPLTSRLPSRASFRLLLSSKRTLALLAAVVLLALLGSASSQASSSATSEPHYRLPASRFNPATWRAPFSFSWGDSRTGSATCTPHAPQDLAERFDRASRPLDVKATTSQRLDDWEFEAPGWGVEPADWVRRNVQSCPSHRIKPNQNQQLLDNSHLVWTALNTTGIMGLRGEMIEFLRRKEKEGKMGRGAWGEGKGLVFTAGNADTFTRVLVTLKILRNRLYTTLPAEIFSYPGEEPSDEVRAELKKYGATLRKVEEAQRDTKRTKNYQIKASAIVRSSFREVLFLDSDSVPTASLMPMDAPTPPEILERAKRDNRSLEAPWDLPREDGTMDEIWGKPAGLWEGKAYQRLGAMMWPDYWRTQPDNPIWAIIGVPCRDEWEMEAGQILVDKAKHLDALLLAEWMMDRERFSYWFNFSDGDKDMFRFAFLALRKRWAVPGRYVSVGALPRDTMSGFCGLTMLQNDHYGRPMFVHYNLLKQVPSGVGRNFAWGRHRQVRTPPSTLLLQGEIGQLTDSRELEKLDPLRDDDLDADYLADATNDGYAMQRVGMDAMGWRTRRRAVWEKGIRAAFHGGWVSALCIDYHWDDPRSEQEKTSSKMSAALGTPNPEHKSLEDLADSIDISYTSAPDGFELKFDSREVLEVMPWGDDPRLRDFEAAFFDEGGIVNGQGF